MAATSHLVLWMMFVVTVIPLTNGLPVDLIVDTTQGKLQGFELDESYAFWGIPFAQPPVGNLRLRDPQPPESWADVRNATEHSDGCMQRCHEPPPACPVNVSTLMFNRTSKLPPLNRKRLSRYSPLVFMLLNSIPDRVVLFDFINTFYEANDVISMCSFLSLYITKASKLRHA